MPLSRTSYTHALTTVRIATQTTQWCVARSDVDQRGSIALRNRGTPRIDVSKMSQPNLMSQFVDAFEREFGAPQPKDPATQKCEILRDTMHVIALATFGKKTSMTHDWFDAKSSEITPVIEAKRIAPIEYKRSPSERNLQIIRAVRGKVQQTARRCANGYWTQLSLHIDSRHSREHQMNVRWR